MLRAQVVFVRARSGAFFIFKNTPIQSSYIFTTFGQTVNCFFQIAYEKIKKCHSKLDLASSVFAVLNGNNHNMRGRCWNEFRMTLWVLMMFLEIFIFQRAQFDQRLRGTPHTHRDRFAWLHTTLGPHVPTTLWHRTHLADSPQSLG